MSEFTPTTDQVRKEYAFDASVEAVWDALYDDGHNGFDCRPDNPLDVTAERALRAALPHIEAQIREQIAREIEAISTRGPGNGARHPQTIRTIAARIARGTTRQENLNVRP